MLYGEFSKFFDSADSIHRARSKEKFKAQRLGKTDAELGKEALEIAMHSDALRQAERELKDLILWTLGKPELWEHMIKERTRLFRERADAEHEEEKRQLAHKKKIADQFMFGMYFIGFGAFLFCFIMAGVGVYGAMEEKRIYEAKVAQRNLAIRQQAKEREARERKEREDYAKN